MAQSKGREIKVGLFVVTSVIVIVFMFVLIGKARQSFDKQVEIYSIFDKVSGLKEGSIVQLSGIKVGLVSKIQVGIFQKKMPNGKTEMRSRIKVVYKVKEEMVKWIRKDSVASIVSQGFFGGSTINISMGVLKKGLSSTGEVRGINPSGMADFIAAGQGAVVSLKNSLKKVETVLHDPQINAQVSGIVEAINSMLQRAKTGPGFLHNLVYSKNFAQWINSIMKNIRNSTKNLTVTTARVNRLIWKIQRKGTFFERFAISNQGGTFFKRVDGVVKETKGALGKVNTMLAGSKKPGTLLYKIFTSKKSGRIVDNFVAVSKSTKSIIQKIEQGKGSLGALINDPTAFENFKTILGQIKRNYIFKNLVRFLIKRDDSVKGGKIKRK